MVLWEGVGEESPTNGNIESVASSWASSEASAPHRPSSQTCNTSGRTCSAKRSEVKQTRGGTARETETDKETWTLGGEGEGDEREREHRSCGKAAVCGGEPAQQRMGFYDHWGTSRGC